MSKRDAPFLNKSIVSLLLVFVGFLWAIWIQPHTIAARNLFLVIGCVLGFYVIYQSIQRRNKVSLSNKGLWSFVCIALLLIWILIHYFFFSKNPQLQLEELSSIWKRIVISLPFAIAAGTALAFSGYLRQRHLDSKLNWPIIILGACLCIPTILYLVRYLITNDLGAHHWPDALQLLYPPSSWYIPKTGYVFFCLPVLALTLADLLRIVNAQIVLTTDKIGRFLVDLLLIFSVLCVFYLENIKNGIAHSFILIIIGIIFFIRQVLFSSEQSSKNSFMSKKNLLLLTIIFVLGMGMFYAIKNHIDKNDSWKSLFADTKVAWQTEKYDHWKYLGQKGYPQNEYGKTVSITNYERVAWAKIALTFVDDYPLGYGLVLESYGHIAKEKYPESSLLQAHSAWLDLLLGLGIPGVSLLFFSGLFALIGLHHLKNDTAHYKSYLSWFLGSMLLCMITTEVAQKVYLDALIFTIVFCSAYCLAAQSLESVDH